MAASRPRLTAAPPAPPRLAPARAALRWTIAGITWARPPAPAPTAPGSARPSVRPPRPSAEPPALSVASPGPHKTVLSLTKPPLSRVPARHHARVLPELP